MLAGLVISNTLTNPLLCALSETVLSHFPETLLRQTQITQNHIQELCIYQSVITLSVICFLRHVTFAPLKHSGEGFQDLGWKAGSTNRFKEKGHLGRPYTSAQGDD